MVTKEDIEVFLNRLSAEGASYKEVKDGFWVVKPGGSLDFDMVVNYSPPVVLLRVKVMDLPKDDDARAQLSERLLEMNASEMVHGAYGIEQDAVVITEALELSHLDFEEFLVAYESIALALASHLREIGQIGTSGTYRVPVATRKKTGAASRKKSAKTARPSKKKNTRAVKRSAGRTRGRR